MFFEKKNFECIKFVVCICYLDVYVGCMFWLDI